MRATRERITLSHGYSLVSCLAVAVLAGVLSACGSSDSVQSSPGVSCANYALHGTGNYRNELSIRVKVSNSAAHPAHYAVDVALTVSHGGPTDASAAQVTIDGWVSAGASAELGRKVLTASPVQSCRVIRITQLSGS